MSQERSQAMSRMGLTVAALLLMSAVSTVRAEAPTFDGRRWSVGNQQQNGAQSLIEFVLPGQTVENWKELVTSTLYFQAVSLARFVERLHKSLGQGCPSLVWNVIKQDEKTAIVEWRDSGCGGFEATSELTRITLEGDGLYRLAYAVKGPLTAERRQQWLTILEQTPLAEAGARESQQRRPAKKDLEQAVRMAQVTEVLVNFMRDKGQPCATPAKADIVGQTEGPQGPITEFLLVCADDARYTMLFQPSGAITAFPARK